MTGVLIVGHADGDGHLIVEQTRRNLAAIPNFEVQTLVDPKRTQGHQVWTRLNLLPELEQPDIIFFVDLMFSPMGFVEQARGLTEFAQKCPERRIFVIDHHPVPNNRLAAAPNVKAHYRPHVFECTFGPRSGLMVVAALCEHQEKTVRAVVTPEHERLALGVRRAAAHGSPLCGRNLLSLLRNSRWDLLDSLAQEDKEQHKTVRGRRVANLPQSPSMATALEALDGADKRSVKRRNPEAQVHHAEGVSMPYDIGVERFSQADSGAHNLTNAPAPAKDLETLMTLLEVAALSLSGSSEPTFALEELIAEAAMIGGEGIFIDIEDVKIVLEKFRFIERAGNKLRLC